MAGLVSCPHCGGQIEQQPQLAGAVITCLHCRGLLRMPVPDALITKPVMERPPPVQPDALDFLDNQTAGPPAVAGSGAMTGTYDFLDSLSPGPTYRQTAGGVHVNTSTTVIVKTTAAPSNSLAVTSLVLGVLALLFCWIPLIGFIAIVAGGLGALLGIISFAVAAGRGGHGMGFAVGGVCLSVVAVIVQITIIGAMASTAAAINRAAAEQQRMEQRGGN